MNEKTENDKKEALILLFMREVRALFLRMSKENVKHIVANGYQVSAEKFSKEWETILSKHCARVQKSFEKQIEKTLPEEDQGTSDLEESLLLAYLLTHCDRATKENSETITKTNEKNLADSLDYARNILIAQGLTITNRSLAVTANVYFLRFIKSRINKIATFTTQSIAENAKIAEATILSGGDPNSVLNPVIPERNNTLKIWKDVGDSKVRDLHVFLNNTEKYIYEPFISGGESLMYPCDVSLGATAKNVMNCRCRLEYKLLRIRR